jgi:hypothetical protein
MKKKILLGVLGLAFLVFFSYGFSECGNMLKVREAVSILDDPDIYKVRTAISDLGKLAYAANITVAVNPLIRVLKNPSGTYDVFTRSMSANSLALISRANPGRMSERILESLLDSLLNDRLDLLRASIPSALILAGEEGVIPVLEVSYYSDPIVREQACHAMVSLTNGRYSCDGEIQASGQSGSQIAVPTGTLSNIFSNPGSECLDDETYHWIKRHTIILDPKYDLESFRCPSE